MNRRKLITAGLGLIAAPAQAQMIGDSYWKTATPSTPVTIFGANLFAWYKADTGVTLSGSNVTGWADQSGNGFNMSQVNQNGTAQTTPTFSATGFNTSFPGISFADGSANGLTSSAANINSNQFAFFGVVNTNPRVDWAYYNPATENSAGIADGALVLYGPDSTHLGSFASGGGPLATVSFAASTNYRLASIWDNAQAGTSSLVNYVNNVGGTPSTLSVGTWGNAGSAIVLGAAYTGGAVTAQGFTIAEFVVVKGVVNSGQRASLDTYFRSKWGL